MTEICDRGEGIEGIVVPMITPLTSSGELDTAGLERLVEHVIEGGVHCMFLLGTTGEGPALHHSMRKQIVQRVCKHAAGRVRVIVAVMDSAFAETMDMIKSASEVGADAVVAAPPFYLPVSQGDIYRYARAIADHSPLPVYLYNVPNPKHPRFSIETLRELSKVENIMGIKDSSGDMGFLVEAIAAFASRPDTSVLLGPEELLAQGMEQGARGGVHGGANLFPRLYVSLYQACLRKQSEQIERLHAIVLDLAADFYTVGEPESSLLRGLKAAASLLGICGPTLVQPYVSATEREQAELANRLSKYAEFMNGRVSKLI